MISRPYAELSDQEIMSLCVWREARGEGIEGKRGVAHVIKNRVNKPGWWGSTVQSVILHPFQFSSFNNRDPNAALWPEDTDSSYVDCYDVSEGVLAGTDEDLTDGCDSYYDDSITPPYWANSTPLVIGRLRFFKLGAT